MFDAIASSFDGMNLIELLVMLAFGVLVGSLLASWLMAVVSRTLLRFPATWASCFSAYWWSVLFGTIAGLILGFGIATGKVAVSATAQSGGGWQSWVTFATTSLVCILVYSHYVRDLDGRRLGLLRSIGLNVIYYPIIVGLAAFAVWAFAGFDRPERLATSWCGFWPSICDWTRF
ncbi:hypothetical protein [Frigidibacter sp. SD6-1]|uniref:hypothetical protein n=1 Tax=Frigidibacter sp. SD6-1 TaxID=3032581 RepID=UPI0024DF57BB|nr:hypothetical protein [Frigidibacter sp. SD6-1]